METTQTIEIQNAQNFISNRFDELIEKNVFLVNQKAAVLQVIFDEGFLSDLSIVINENQSRWVQSLIFEYLDKKNDNTPSALYELVTSERNNLKRYLATADDLTPRGMFDFSPIEPY